MARPKPPLIGFDPHAFSILEELRERLSARYAQDFADEDVRCMEVALAVCVATWEAHKSELDTGAIANRLTSIAKLSAQMQRQLAPSSGLPMPRGLFGSIRRMTLHSRSVSSCRILRSSGFGSWKSLWP